MCNWLLVASEKGLEGEREMGNSCGRQKTTISVIRRTGTNGNRVNVFGGICSNDPGGIGCDCENLSQAKQQERNTKLLTQQQTPVHRAKLQARSHGSVNESGAYHHKLSMPFSLILRFLTL